MGTFKNNSCGVVYLHASCGVFYQQIPQGRQRVTPCIASSSQFSNRHGVGSVEDDNQCIRFGLGVSELGEHWHSRSGAKKWDWSIFCSDSGECKPI